MNQNMQNDCEETPEEAVKRWQESEKKERVIRDVQKGFALDLLRKDGARDNHFFFFPDSGLDWNPLFRFTDVCRTFVYCDPGTERDTFLDKIETIRRRTSVGQALARTRGHSFDLSLDVLNRDCEFAVFQWAYCIELDRKVPRTIQENETRKILLVWLCADSVEAYSHLFMRQNSAPKFLCVKNSAWNERLKQAVFGAETQPKYIVGDWPKLYSRWTVLWQRYRSWGETAVFQRPDPRPEAPLGFEHNVNVDFTLSPLVPANVAEADAIFVDLETFLRHAWPPHIQAIFVDVPDEAIDDRMRELLPSVVPLRLSGLPMITALDRLAMQCAERRLHCVSSIRFGFEDEGIALNHWRENCPDWTLRFHCETVAEMNSLVGQPAPAI